MGDYTRQEEAKIIFIQNMLEGSPKATRKDMIILGYDPKYIDEAFKRLGKEKNPKKESVKRIFTKRGQTEQFLKEYPFFYDESGSWWLWQFDKKYWKRLNDETDLLNLIADGLGIDTIDSKSKNEIINAMKQIGRKNIPKPIEPTWIQFANGIVDINRNPHVFEPSPDYFVTNPIDWAFGDNEETPTMDRIFEEWVGVEYRETLYEIIAYCLLCDYPIHRIFCFVGEGLNGKSCFLNLLRIFLGNHNVTSTELDTLIKSRFEVTRLHKKLACQMGETDFNELNKTSLLKKLSGSDLVGFEYKNKNPFEDINYAKILISTNNLPATTDKTIGFYRRWLIIDFPRKFTEKRDILKEIPISEYESLARKSVRILRELLQKREFTNEGTIEERIRKYEDRSDPLNKFLTEFTEEDYDSFIWRFDFEKRLNQWCKENKFRQIGEVSIGKKMKQRGVETGRRQADWLTDTTDRRIRTWEGIRWKKG